MLTQPATDRSELRSENKHFKSCLPVVMVTDPTKHEFRLFTNQHHYVVISAHFDPFTTTSLPYLCLDDVMLSVDGAAGVIIAWR